MIHLGDITQIDGGKIPPVDCITGGSPCQDLSIAGKREGLAGKRSGLFMEQIRIIKEMRERDRARGRTGYMVRPRFMVWENAPGAFSSGSPKGSDFAAVIEEIIKICEPKTTVSVRIPDRGWNKSGCYYAENGSWSIAWRLHDAQFWGVPQRRKRIALVADFGGMSAPEVLFERKGLRRDIDQSEPAGEEVAGETGEGADGTSWCIKGNAIDRDTAQNGQWANEDVSYSLDATDRNGVAVPINMQIATRYKALGERTGLGVGADGDPAFTLQAGHEHGVAVLTNRGIYSGKETETLRAQSHGAIPMVAAFKWNQGSGAGSIGYEEETSPTLNTDKNPAVFDARGNGNGAISPSLIGDHQNRVTDYTALCVGNGQLNQISMAKQANTLDAMHDQQAVLVPDTAHALRAKGNCSFREDSETYVCRHAIVRRLTPLECERLQGYPDGWTDIGEWTDSKGKKRQTTDTARYKALGNSIALPFWFWLLRRISAQYERPATLGSLFDGIGGFPLCWERCNGKGMAIWASEIEEFPIAVTKRRFRDG